MVTLGRHISDPAMAWPRPARKLLPGPVGFYTVAFVLACLLGIAAFLAYRLFKVIDVGQQRLQPLFSTLVMQMITAIYEQASRTGKPIERPVLIVLDECANIAPIRELPSTRILRRRSRHPTGHRLPGPRPDHERLRANARPDNHE